MATANEYRFTVTVEQEEDGGYVVKCPALPGCYTQGDTYEEAMANIRDVIALCIEDMRESGEDIPNEIRTETIAVAV